MLVMMLVMAMQHVYSMHAQVFSEAGFCVAILKPIPWKKKAQKQCTAQNSIYLLLLLLLLLHGGS